MTSILVSTLLSILGKLVSSDFITYLLIKGAEILASKTDNKYDDEIVAKIAEVLGKKAPEAPKAP